MGRIHPRPHSPAGSSCKGRRRKQARAQDATGVVTFINTRPFRCPRNVAITCNGLNIHQSPLFYVEVCCMSHGKILKRTVRGTDELYFSLFTQKGKYQIWTHDDQWLSVVYCLANIFEIMNALNLFLRGKRDVLTKSAVEWVSGLSGLIFIFMVTDVQGAPDDAWQFITFLV